jgi:DNA-binding NarL/FixJ family response regulator
MINIIIADDHPIFIDGLKTVLEGADGIKITGEAYNGTQVLDRLKTMAADVILLDINMPEMDGLVTAQHIIEKFPKVKVIMLTQYDEPAFIRRCKKIGVNGYLLKDCGKQLLTHAIHLVHEGGTLHATKNGSNNGFEVPDLLLKEQITENEKKILKLIAEEKSNHEIAEMLGKSENTIKKQRERLMCKAGVNKTAGLIYWAMKNKLLD